MSLSTSCHSSSSSLAHKRALPSSCSRCLHRTDSQKCVCANSRTSSPCPFCISSQSSLNPDSQSTQRPSRVTSSDRITKPIPSSKPGKHSAKASIDDGKRPKHIQANSSFDIKISAMFLKPGKVIAAQPTKSTECESSSQRSGKRVWKKSGDYTSERRRRTRATAMIPKALTRDSFQCNRSKSQIAVEDSQESVYHSRVEQMMIESILTKQQSRPFLLHNRSKSPYSFSVCQSRSHTPVPPKSPPRKSSSTTTSQKVTRSSSRKPSSFQSFEQDEDHRANQLRVNSEYFPGTSFDSAPTSYQTTARVMEPDDDRMMLHFTGMGHSHGINQVAVSEENCLFTASSDYSVGRWKLPRLTPDPYKVDASVIRFGSVFEADYMWRAHSGRVLAILSIENGCLCTGGDDCVLKIWRSANENSYVSESIRTSIGPIHYLSQSFPGAITIASRKHIQSFDISTKQRIASFTPDHKLPITALKAISPSLLATASEDCTAKVWDLRVSRCVTTFLGHRDTVNGLSLFDETRLVTGSDDCSVRGWDLRSAKEVYTYQGDEEAKVVCALGERVVLVGGEGVVVWEEGTARKLKSNVGRVRCIAEVRDTGEAVVAGAEGRFAVWRLLR